MSTSTDNIGNTYWNSFNGISQIFVSTGIWDFNTYFSAALGTRYTRVNQNTRNSYFTFNHPNEGASLPVTSSNYRWAIRDPGNLTSHIFGGFASYSQTQPDFRHLGATNSSVLSRVSGSFLVGATQYNNFISVTNQYSTIWYLWHSPTANLQNITSCSLIYFGYTKDSFFTGSNFLSSSINLLYSWRGSSNTNQLDIVYPYSSVWVGCLNSGNSNYSISCENATAGANITDFCPRDSGSPFNAIGRCWNLIYSPSAITMGTIIKSTGVDPDSGDNPFWLSVANFNSGSLLMRIRTTDVL
jgi:hypothetical protein